MAEPLRRPHGLLDTSVVIDLEIIDPVHLPVESSISTVTLAELAAGPHATADPEEKAMRQTRLQNVEASIEAITFDSTAARAFGRVYAAVAVSGRKVRGRRSLDLLIAATALSSGLPLYSRNPEDLAGLEGLIEVVTV